MTFVWMCLADKITGGHFNPAITVCMWLSSKKLADNSVVMLFMIIGQFAGAMLAMLFGWLCMMDYKYMDYVANVSPFKSYNVDHGVPRQFIHLIGPY